MNIQALARSFGLPYNRPFIHFYLLGVALLEPTWPKRILLFLFSYLTGLLSGTLKLFFRVSRPCFGQDGCPISFDFPSDHSALGAFHAMYFWNRGNKLAAFVSLLHPVARYVAGVHSLKAVMAGSLLGVVMWWIFQLVTSAQEEKNSKVG